MFAMSGTEVAELTLNVANDALWRSAAELTSHVANIQVEE
jgi:hypothetical protein